MQPFQFEGFGMWVCGAVLRGGGSVNRPGDRGLGEECFLIGTLIQGLPSGVLMENRCCLLLGGEINL